jgi:hypothetical protein
LVEPVVVVEASTELHLELPQTAVETVVKYFLALLLARVLLILAEAVELVELLVATEVRVL